MIRPRAARLGKSSWTLVLAVLMLSAGPASRGQQPPEATEEAPGQFFTIAEPITSETIARVRAAARQLVDSAASAEHGKRPILVFEFLPGDVAPGASEFGACYDLANLISKELAGARLTVAYHPQAAPRLCRPARSSPAPRSSWAPTPASGPSPPRASPSTPPIASWSASSPCARPATPTSCWACSTATPTSAWSAPPTAPCITSWPRTSRPSGSRTRSSRSAPPGTAASAASSPPSAPARRASASGPPTRPPSWPPSTGSPASRPSTTPPWAS